MFASTSCGGRLLKRSLAEIGHAHFLPLTKRRRLSSVNTSRSLHGATSTMYLPYFFTNSRCETLPSPYVPPSCTGPAAKADGGPQDVGKAHSRRSSSQHGLELPRSNAPVSPIGLLRVYGQLSKSRLTSLVVLTSMAGVALSPLPATVPILLCTAVGTALCSASANALNQLAEVPFDAQMARTRMRPLVRGSISSFHATGFAIATGLVGPAVLAIFVNPISALLGAANIGLYAGVYTSLKRTSVLNTWVGAIVGGIPPLIGWTACGGQLFPSSTYPLEFFPPPVLSNLTAALPVECVDNPLSALALFCLLFSWQFPHFNSLAHIVRDSYAQAGYKMLPVTNPNLNTLVSLRHATALVAICSVLTPLSGLTTWAFALTSLIPNAIMSRAAWKFWRAGTEKEAKALFNISLWYLPVVLGLMMFHKQGMEWLALFGWTERKTSKEQEPAEHSV